jgi:hypothetical protein
MARVILSLEELLALAARPLTVHIPELLTLGARIMEAAGQIRQAIDELAVIVETEAGEIAALVHPNITQGEVDDIVGRLHAMGESIRGFAPTPEPPQA